MKIFIIAILTFFQLSSFALASDYLDRVAVWNNDPPSITYFSREDMAAYGFTDEDEFITWYTERLKQGNKAGYTFELFPIESVNG